MADEDDSSGEFAEALADTYTNQEMKEMLATVRWRSDSPQEEEEIKRQIEYAASWYAPYRYLLQDHRQPSVRERRMNAALNKLRAGDLSGVRNFSPTDRGYLEWAGQDLVKADGKLPDVQPELEELPKRPGQTEPDLMTIWNTRRQIEMCLEHNTHQDWLARCVARAIELTIREKTRRGSKVPDEGLRTTIRLLYKVYQERAADPRTPGADISDDDSMWREGELLNFLEAALSPLTPPKTREAICQHWLRATGRKK